MCSVYKLLEVSLLKKVFLVLNTLKGMDRVIADITDIEIAEKANVTRDKNKRETHPP